MKNYKQYTFIKRMYTKETKEQTNKNITYMLDGWEICRDRFISEYLTKREQNKIQTETETKNAIIKKMKARTEKAIADFCKKADEIAQAEIAGFIIIRVNWAKSKTWGYNPTANVYAYDNAKGAHFQQATTGHASGCGYDKLSASTAQAFNDNIHILKILYNRWEEALRKGESVRDFVGYGCGYGSPYFEGGVGYSSQRAIFDNAGAKLNIWQEGELFEFMSIEF